MIKNVIFDNGGVIVKYSAHTYLDYYNFPKNKQKILDQLFTSEEWVIFAKGKITSDDFKEYAVKRFPEFKEDVLKILDVDALHYLIPPYQETLDFIHQLKNSGYKVFLLSDINEDTITYLKKEIPGFEDLFDGIVYSCRVGMVKKDGLVFKKLLDDFNLNPEETLFLDDSIFNLEQAQNYKINTYHFLDPAKDIYHVKSLLRK